MNQRQATGASDAPAGVALSPKRYRWVWRIVAGFWAASMCVALPAFGQPLEVHELMEDLQPWIGKSVTVQGRLQSAGAGRLKLVGVPIDFRYSEARIPIRPGTVHLEITGKFERGGQQPVMRVESLEPIPSEAQQFAARRGRIAAENFEALYELSRWARARAKWYADAELRGLASQSYREAFSRQEEKLVHDRDIEGLLHLAEHGEQLGLEAPEALRIRYRAMALKAAALNGRDPRAWRALADEARSLLPGADAPNPAPQEPLRSIDPGALMAEYAAAEVEDRPALHRALWGALVARALALRAEAGDANLLELSRDARRELPEYPDLALSLERDGWLRVASRAEQLSREELIAAREALARLEMAEQSASMIEHWLRHRRERLAADEAEERVQLAQEYLELTDDRAAAATLYREALAIAGDFAAAAAGLRRLGYEQVGGVWRSADDLPPPSEAGAVALRTGAGEVEVIRLLRRPDRIARTVSRRWITEQWTFDGPQPLVVYLRRDMAGGQGVVTRVTAP